MATGAYGSGAKKFHFEFTLKIGAVVFFFVVAAKLLNFLKKIMVGSLFGISWEADSFFAATYLPYYAAVFFEGVIYLGFIPRFSRILAEEGEKAAKFFAGGMLAWLILLSGMLAVGFCLGAPWVIRGIVPGFKVHSIALTQELFGIVNFVILFITLSSFFQSLNSFFGQPLKAASSGLTDSLAMITVTFLTYRWLGIYGAAWGAVTGAFLAFCLQAFFLRQRYRFLGLGLRLRLRPLAELVKILLPLGMIWVFQMVPLVILNRFGSGMWQGTITSLTIALGIMVVPTGLVSQTILISVFPSLAKQASEATPENVRSTFFGTLRATFFVLIPAGFLLSGFSGPMAALFFGGQSGASEGTIRIANALACLGWSAFAFYADLFMTQSLITIRKAGTAIFLCGARAVLTCAFCYVLSGLWDYQGLALGFSLGLVVNWLVFFPLFFRRTPLAGRWRELFLHVLKLSIAAAPMLAGCWVLKPKFFAFVMHWAPTGLLIGTGFLLLAVSLFFFLVIRCLNVKELAEVTGLMRRLWSEKRWWITDTGAV